MPDQRVEATAASARPAATPAPEAKPAGANLLFLREEEIRAAQDLLFFAYRDFTGAADVILEELGMGRAHHRALHFIGRNPRIPVSDLLAILRITKQSLARVLTTLVERGYVTQAQGRDDRRQRLLSLTPAGEALERRLFARQRERLSAAYRDAGGAAVEGFRRVMRGIMDEAARSYMDRAEAAQDGAPAPSHAPAPRNGPQRG
ncbi:MAG: MarR family transcriptional regulator [Proteobacteria bacterium]|nr:MarR family transcriptional regulator [Pseudomonadota bacterium]